MPSNSPRQASAAPSAASDPERVELGGLEDLLGFRARMAHVAIYRHFTAALADLQISQRHTALLWLIGANPGISQGALGATLGMDSATMVGVIDRLEKEGRVIRKPSTVDRRRRELYLTPAGAALLQKVKKAVARHEQRFRSRFTDQQLAALMDALRIISET